MLKVDMRTEMDVERFALKSDVAEINKVLGEISLIVPKLDLRIAQQQFDATLFATSAYVEEVLENQKHGVKHLT